MTISPISLAFEKSNQLEDLSYSRDTNPSQTYIKICNEFKKEPPNDDWDGVYNFKSKVRKFCFDRRV